MDQKALYEQQSGPAGEMVENNDPALVGRDMFVTNAMKRALASLPKSFRVAELSIGEGRLTRLMLKCFPDAKIAGFDISKNRINHVQDMLNRTPSLNAKEVQLFECNFDTQFSSIESSSYNFAIALDVMEHVMDVFGFVENCHRILANNGILFIRVPNIAYIKHRLRLLHGKLPVTSSWFGPPEQLSAWHQQHGWDGGHLHLFTVPVLYSLLERCGFRIEECRDPGTKFEGLRDMLPNLLYSNPLIVARKVRVNG